MLTGARHITLAGHYAYITADAGLVVVDLDDPLAAAQVTAQLPLTDARATALQFRYLWVTDAEGLKLFDVTNLAQPVAVPAAHGAARRCAARLSRAHLRLCRGEGATASSSSTSRAPRRRSLRGPGLDLRRRS